MPTKEQVVEVFKTTMDPELMIDVDTLGLIYDYRINKDNSIYVKMTFTTPACPYGPMLIEELKSKLKALEGVKDVEVEITFEPLWQPSDELKAMLGIGV